MFFKQEKPEMDDFERLLVLKENVLRKYCENVNTFNPSFAKISPNIFAFSFVSEYSKPFFLIWKKLAFFALRCGVQHVR